MKRADLTFAGNAAFCTAALLVPFLSLPSPAPLGSRRSSDAGTNATLAVCKTSAKELDQLDRPSSLLTALGSNLSAAQIGELRQFFIDTQRLKAANADRLRKTLAGIRHSSKVDQMVSALADEAALYGTAANAIARNDLTQFSSALLKAASRRNDALKDAKGSGLAPCAELGGFGRPSQATYTDLGSSTNFENLCADENFSVLSCDAPHLVEQFGGFILPGDGTEFPGRDLLSDVASSRCSDQFSPYVGLDSDQSVFEIRVLTPNATAWAQRDYSNYCILERRDGQLTIGSAFKVNE